MLTLARLCLWTATAPCLTLAFAGEVVYFIGVDVEDDLASACVLVFDD
jgi:hypothetical protein